MTTNYFIVNEHYHDFSLLKEGGALIPLTKGPVNVFHNERIKLEMIQKMKDANVKDSDFIVVCGAGVLVALAVLSMKELVGKVNLALYNHNDKSYKFRLNV